MQHIQPKPSATSIITQRDVEMDSFLPVWARRSNPVVRRELGLFWKRLFPDMTLISKIIIGEMLLILLPIQFLLTVTLPIAMLGVVMLPALVFLYGRIMLTVVNAAAVSIVNATNNNTLDLLRVTPLSAKQIVLGKIAASVWQRVEDLDLILIGGIIFSLPFWVIHYVGAVPADEVTLFMRFITMIAIVHLPLRAMLEPFMFAAVALAAGAALPTRAAAVITAFSFMVFYYLALFIPLAAPLAFGVQFLLEIVLPILIPILVIAGAVRFAIWQIER